MLFALKRILFFFFNNFLLRRRQSGQYQSPSGITSSLGSRLEGVLPGGQRDGGSVWAENNSFNSVLLLLQSGQYQSPCGITSSLGSRLEGVAGQRGLGVRGCVSAEKISRVHPRRVVAKYSSG